MAWLYGLTDDEISEFPGTIKKLVPEGTLEVTEKPIEGGSTLTDHSVLKPFRLTAVVHVSPVEVRPGIKLTVKRAVELLQEIQRLRSVNTLSLLNDVGPWEELLLAKWSVIREFEAGNGGELECEFQQITTATAQVSAPVPRRPRDRPRVNRGPQAPTDSPRESALHAIGQRLLGSGLLGGER